MFFIASKIDFLLFLAAFLNGNNTFFRTYLKRCFLLFRDVANIKER